RTPRIEAVVGIALEQGGRDFGRLTESRASDDQTGKGFDVPMMVGKPDRQIIEQFRMAGQFALGAEVGARLDEAGAEELLPVTIDGDAGGERVVRRHQPTSE